MTLQSIQTPPGWQGAPEGAPEPDLRAWETTGGLRAIVTARALGGCKRGRIGLAGGSSSTTRGRSHEAAMGRLLLYGSSNIAKASLRRHQNGSRGSMCGTSAP